MNEKDRDLLNPRSAKPVEQEASTPIPQTGPGAESSAKEISMDELVKRLAGHLRGPMAPFLQPPPSRNIRITLGLAALGLFFLALLFLTNTFCYPFLRIIFFLTFYPLMNALFPHHQGPLAREPLYVFFSGMFFFLVSILALRYAQTTRRHVREETFEGTHATSHMTAYEWGVLALNIATYLPYLGLTWICDPPENVEEKEALRLYARICLTILRTTDEKLNFERLWEKLLKSFPEAFSANDSSQKLNVLAALRHLWEAKILECEGIENWQLLEKSQYLPSPGLQNLLRKCLTNPAV